MLKFIVFFLFIFLGVYSPAKAADLHLIVVTDLSASGIAESVLLDAQNIRREMFDVSIHTALNLKETLFIAEDIEVEALKESLVNLIAQPDDVLFFYFSGHGYRTLSDGEDPWPNLYLEGRNQSLPFKEVISELLTKQARLVLLIADCCNSYVEEDDEFNLAVTYKQSYSKQLQQNYRKLFLETNGLIAISGAEPGGSSFASNRGGIYTYSFIKNLKSICQGESSLVTWSALIESTRRNVKNQNDFFGDKQDPIHLLLLF